MIFLENRLLANDSQEISNLFFFRKLGKMSTNLLSAAVVVGALRVKMTPATNCLITTWHNLKTRFTKKANYEANMKAQFED